MLIDSGVWPGVARISSVTVPSERRCPCVEPFDRERNRARRPRRKRSTAPGLLREFEVAGQEVGVEVRLDDPLDREAARRRVVEILPDVALRIDDDRATGARVADEIRRVRQALEVVLLEDERTHRAG